MMGKVVHLSNSLGQLHSQLSALEGAPVHRVNRILGVVPGKNKNNSSLIPFALIKTTFNAFKEPILLGLGT